MTLLHDFVTLIFDLLTLKIFICQCHVSHSQLLYHIRDLLVREQQYGKFYHPLLNSDIAA